MGIIIYLTEKPMKIQPRGYSETLHNKIVSCFNDKDVELLWKSVEAGLLRFMN